MQKNSDAVNGCKTKAVCLPIKHSSSKLIASYVLLLSKGT